MSGKDFADWVCGECECGDSKGECECDNGSDGDSWYGTSDTLKPAPVPPVPFADIQRKPFKKTFAQFGQTAGCSDGA